MPNNYNGRTATMQDGNQGQGGSQGGKQGGNENGNTSKRGFASMDPQRQREIASMGGRASGGNFAYDPSRAAEIGRRGGQNSHVARGEHL